MKLSWRDLITAVLAVLGGAVVYAKFYNYSWALIGSWRSSAAVLALIGLAIFAFSSFDFANRSILNIGEMILGVAVIGLAVAGMIVVSEPVFYVLAAAIGAWWLVDTARHARHSLIHGQGTTSFHTHAHVH